MPHTFALLANVWEIEILWTDGEERKMYEINLSHPAKRRLGGIWRFLFLVYFGPNPASICRGFPLQPSTIASHGSTDDIFQSALINSITLMEIDCSPLIAFKAGIEELVWIWKACTSREGQLYLVLVSIGHAD